MEKGLLLILLTAAVWDWTIASSCNYEDVTCEWKYKTFQWSCPEGKIPVARAFWGRDPGDNSTCVDQVPSVYLQNLNCPGDDSKAAEAVTNWCTNNVGADGMCTIRAANEKLVVNGSPHDPCVGTFKYLRVCRHCTTPVGLRLASFMVTSFGRNKWNDDDERPYIVKICSRYDLVVVEDIRDASQQTIPDLVAALTASTGETWAFMISQRLGRSNQKIQSAFVYRTKKVEVKKTYQYPDLADVFEREPFGVVISAPDTNIGEFAIMAIQAKPANAEIEVDALVDVFDHMSSALGTEKILIAGDMLADCRYITASEWPSVRLRHDNRFTWLIQDSADTTTSATDCAYDRFVVRKGPLESAIIPGSVNIYKFDSDYGLTQQQANDVSNHYPIELELAGKVPE